MIKRAACLTIGVSDPFRIQAIEQQFMDTLPEESAILFLWQSDRTVFLGKCQDPADACNLTSFQTEGGVLARRITGGGSFYCDGGCLGFSLIVPKDDFSVTHQLNVPARVLTSFGFRPQWDGVGDLLVSGKTVCKTAFRKNETAALHHGVLFVQCDIGKMSEALLPADQVPSVSPLSISVHTINLSELTASADVSSVKSAFFRAVGEAYSCPVTSLEEALLNPKRIEELSYGFSSEAYVFPKHMNATFTASGSFPWGTLKAELLAESGLIREASLYTDAMETALFEEMENILIGSPYLISSISGRIRQRFSFLTDRRLLQMVNDSCTFICGHIRSKDRAGSQSN